MKHGDFTQLAENYSKYRPGYSTFIRDVVLKMVDKNLKDLHFVDVGAGTGIWTRMIAEKGCKTIAVEPNVAMLDFGKTNDKNSNIQWVNRNAENTGLGDASVDLVSMASSFHWPDFDATIKEFIRILKPGGYFLALWNTRFLVDNPILIEIEDELQRIVPDLKRVSSGRSEFCQNLMGRLLDVAEFKDVLYLEGRHQEEQSPKRYIGLWESVNDVKVQAGPERFQKFLDYIRKKISDIDYIKASYTTCAWVAQKK